MLARLVKLALFTFLALGLMLATKSAEAANPRVKFITTEGDLVIELFADKAPLTVKNFLFYVNEGRYNHTLFHRIIEGFVVQGGGFKDGMKQIDVEDPIKLESDNGLKNLRGTIAMARHSKKDSADSQFFFNMRDNTNLDKSDLKDGYAVFGKVVEGLETLDFMSIVETLSTEQYSDIPKHPVLLITAEVVEL